MRNEIFRFAVCVVLLKNATAYAGETITNTNNEVVVSVGGQNLAYHEVPSSLASAPVRQDGYFDSNIGTMPAFGLDVTRQGTLAGISNVFLALDMTGAVGKTEYTGTAFSTQCNGIPTSILVCSPVSRPHAERDSEFTFDVDAKIGKAIPLGSRAQVTPYVTVGAQVWDRNAAWLNGDDSYRQWDAGTGILVQCAATNRLVLGVDVALEEVFGAHAHEDGVVYPLGSRPLLAAALSADYAVTRRLHLAVTYRFQHFRYGISPVRGPQGGSIEPASWTTTQAVMAGIGWRY